MKKTFLMTLALLCAVAQGAWAESVTFNVRSWDATKKLVVTTTETKDATVLTGSHSDDWLGLGGGDDQDYYYVVKGNVSYLTLNCFGRVHLILADGATLTCTGGIKVEESNNNAHLFIYSQGDGDREGRLIVTNSYEDAAGIGSSSPEDQGPIEIHGGYLDVTGGQYAAGIGAGRCSSFTVAHAGTVTVYGGTVKAQGGTRGAGIGAGAGHSAGTTSIHYSNGADFSLYGGTVTATGGELAAGVGGGGGYQAVILPDITAYGGGGGKCHVYGGTLTAQGGRRGAGIGAGNKGSGDSGYNINSGEVHIEGGTVTATGGDYGAGIGGGCNCSGGTVNISGGTVTATGRVNGAGIGGGEDGKGGTVTITGGTVIAIAGGECKAREAKGGSAIGCGKGVSDKGDPTNFGSLSMPDNYRVTAGDAENDIERMFTAGERVAACTWRNYAKIDACPHAVPTVGSDRTAAVTYTVDGDRHTSHCRYCAYTLQENHTFVSDVCNACGKRDNTSDDLWDVTLYRATGAASTGYAYHEVMKVVKGQPFTIPAVSATNGLTLMGYATSWTDGDGIEMKDGETLTAVGTVVTPEADMNYYPRYRYRYVPTWTWNDDDATATLSIKCSALSDETINVSNITYDTSGEVKTATGTYTHNDATYTFTDTYLLPVNSLDLSDASSNDDNLDTYNGRKVTTLILTGRTLYADGSWNTLCLPFSLSAADTYTNLGSCTLKTLGSSDYDSATGTLTLNFIDATTIEAGKPYLIKWASGGGNRTNPSFSGVTINYVDAAVKTDNVTFQGSFSPVSLAANDKTVLYLGSDNKLYYPTADMTVGSCRAVFRLKDITAGDLASGANARRFVVNFGDGEKTTGIISIDNGQLIIDNSMDAWYTLDGRRLTGKPTAKGLYINNGRKVVIK